MQAIRCIFVVEDGEATTPRPPGGRIGALIEGILEDPTRPATLEILAGRAAMSPRTLLRRFRRETGLTPAKFIERARIEYAKRLLGESDSRTGRVASRAGFGNDERMRRSFHRVLGMSPRAWRQASA